MFVIDLSPIFTFISQFINQVAYDFNTAATAYDVAWLLLFKYWGWLLVVFIFLRFLIYPEYIIYIQDRWFDENITMTLLAIDVPKMNEQSVQAMENFFDHLQGAHGTINKWAKYIEGEYQLGFSCEIASIEGNVQFIMRTPTHWRNLVEAAVYAQFPDAEITEVQDYTGTVPRWYPNDTHDMWGCEFTLSNDKWFPIKTYTKFEHRFSEVFVDPMAALLETMSQIGPGQQMWLQILIKPLEVGWGEKGIEYINKKILKLPESAPKKGLLGEIAGFGSSLMGEVAQQLTGPTQSEYKPEKKEEQPFKMMNLTTGQKDKIEAIEKKIAKLAFDTKIRYIYIAEKDKVDKGVGVNGLVGSIKQWTDMNLNGLKPDLKRTGTNAPQYILIDYRRNSRRNWILGGYIKRDTIRGCVAKPLCSEELASLWHFPSMYVKAPLLKKTEFRKAAAPVDLPFGEAPAVARPKELGEVIAEKTTVIPSFDYDNDSFEMQFAKDKDAFKKSRPEREERLKELSQEDAVRLKQIKKQEKEAGKASKKSDKKGPSFVKASASAPAYVETSSFANASEDRSAGRKATADRPAGEEKKVEKPSTKVVDKEPGLPENLPFID